MKLKFALFELFLIAGVPALIVLAGFHVGQYPLVAYIMWLIGMLTIRGLAGLGWDLYVGFRG